MADTALFLLDASGHHRLAHDSLQWIVQRRSEHKTRGEQWNGISFVGLKRDTLFSVCRDKGVELTPEARRRIEAFPPMFKIWLREHCSSLSERRTAA